MKQNESGFSLIEVISSIVIISIVLLSIGQLIIQSNNTASINNDKLVVIDLSEAILEQLKEQNDVVKEAIKLEANPEQIEIPLDTINFNGLTSKKINGKTYYIIEMDDQTYQVNAYAKKCDEHISKLALQPVLVRVKRIEITTKNGVTNINELIRNSEIEGYVKL